MFELLMLITLLAAAASQLLPEEDDSEAEDRPRRRRRPVSRHRCKPRQRVKPGELPLRPVATGESGAGGRSFSRCCG